MEAFWNGGWFGLGPGEGIAKRSLPDSHTDFVFAVAAEEFGIILCLMLVALFGFIVIRTLTRAYATEDMFSRFAASGLAILFGVQATINMAVNLQLIPAKGMTLPFISYGGSALTLALAGVGVVLAFARHEREALRLLDAAVQATGGQHRAGQREMVLQVARALESRRHLLVQAGTGTGKSLAYLIPALQHAMTQEDPVVVATATLALQAQIMKRDAPRLVEALKDELPREPVVALVKGRSNYLCRHKVDGGYPGDEGEEALFTVADDGGMIGSATDGAAATRERV